MILLSHTLTVRASYVASLVNVHPVVKEEITDRWTDAGRTDGWKIILLSHTLTIRISHVASSVKLRPLV